MNRGSLKSRNVGRIFSLSDSEHDCQSLRPDSEILTVIPGFAIPCSMLSMVLYIELCISAKGMKW